MQIIRVLPIDHQKGFSASTPKKKTLLSKSQRPFSICEAAQNRNKVVLSDTTILKIRSMCELEGMKPKEIHSYFPYIKIDRIHSILQYQTRCDLVPVQNG